MLVDHLRHLRLLLLLVLRGHHLRHRWWNYRRHHEVWLLRHLWRRLKSRQRRWWGEKLRLGRLQRWNRSRLWWRLPSFLKWTRLWKSLSGLLWKDRSRLGLRQRFLIKNVILEVVDVCIELRVDVFVRIRIVSPEFVEFLDHIKFWLLLLLQIPDVLLRTGHCAGSRWLLFGPVEVPRTRSHVKSWWILESASERVQLLCLRHKLAHRFLSLVS